MAIGLGSDFKIYDEQFFGGLFETLTQNADVFDAAGANAIRLVPSASVGNFTQESFYKLIGSLVTRRDVGSTAAAADTALIQDEFATPKVNRKIGPIAQTLDAFRKVGENASAEQVSFRVGQQSGAAVAVDFVNVAISSAEAAIGAVALLNVTATAADIKHVDLIDMLALFGDRSSRIIAWVMHSKPFFDLMKVSVTDKITNVADVTIVDGTVASMGRPIIVTDAASLKIAGTPDTYRTLGLVADAAAVMESEEREIFSEVVTGLENIVVRVQGEYAFNVGLKGCRWDITAGGSNPTDAALATGTNWDKIVTDDKDMLGVAITTN